MQETGDGRQLQKAVIEIINEEPKEIQVTEAGAKSIPGIHAKSIGMDTGSAGAKNGGEERVRFTVQFNPAELQISAAGEADSLDCIGDAAGSWNILGTRCLPSRVQVNFKLIFDGTEDDKPLVRQQVEGFLAALQNKHTRRVSFIWGKLCYSGYLNRIQASYVMFNAKGDPIRANVSLSIRQAGADSDAGTNKSEDVYWKKAWKDFQKLFGGGGNGIVSI